MVDGVLAGGKPGQAGVLGDPDPVLPRKREVPPDAGVGPVPGFEEPDLSGGVGDEGLIPPPVAVLEQGQWRSWVRVLSADDDPQRWTRRTGYGPDG